MIFGLKEVLQIKFEEIEIIVNRMNKYKDKVEKDKQIRRLRRRKKGEKEEEEEGEKIGIISKDEQKRERVNYNVLNLYIGIIRYIYMYIYIMYVRNTKGEL